MGLFSRLRDRVLGRSGSGPLGSELTDYWDQALPTDAGVAVNSTTAMRHTAVMACTSILAEDVAKIPLQLWRRLPNNRKRLATEHPFTPLLRDPNQWQTAFEFKEMMTAALVLRGNGYAVILRNDRNEPEQLVPIHPDRVVLFEAPGGEWFYLVTRNGLHEMAVLREVPMLVPSEDMLHLRWLSMWNSLLGVSRIGLMRESVGLSMSMEHHQARFAGQGVRPSGVLTTEQVLSKEAYDRIVADWQQNQSGWRKAGKTVLLEQGLKWEPLGMTMADAQFIESRRFSLEDIARGFRVPLYKLGVPDATGSETSLAQLDQDYLNNVISSYCERTQQRYEKTFGINGADYFLEWDYSAFLKADIQTRLVALRTGVAGMIYTPNEARAVEGLSPVKGGDVLYQPTNVAPIGFTPSAAGSSGPGSDFTGTPAPGGDGDPGRPADGKTGRAPASRGRSSHGPQAVRRRHRAVS